MKLGVGNKIDSYKKEYQMKIYQLTKSFRDHVSAIRKLLENKKMEDVRKKLR